MSHATMYEKKKKHIIQYIVKIKAYYINSNGSSNFDQISKARTQNLPVRVDTGLRHVRHKRVSVAVGQAEAGHVIIGLAFD